MKRKNKNLKNKIIRSGIFINFLAVILLGLIIGFAANFVFAAFYIPASPAPSDNAPGFLDISANPQYRIGKLWLGDNSSSDSGFALQILGGGTLRTTGTGILNTGGAANGLLVPNGKVGIGTTTPSEKLVLAGGNFLQTASSTISLVGSALVGKRLASVAVSGKYAYAGDINSFYIVDISNPKNPSLISTYVTPSNIYDINVFGKYAYLANYSNGLLILDVSNPFNPIQVGNYPSNGALTVYVSGKYAYFGSSEAGSGLMVIDISKPSQPVKVSSGGSMRVRDVYINGAYAYFTHYPGSNIFSIYNISNPLNPVLVKDVNLASSGFGVYVSGKYAYVADNQEDLVIIDISNPSSAYIKKTFSITGYILGVYVSGNYAYAANADNGGGTGLNVIDISNIDNPREIVYYSTMPRPNNTNSIVVSGKYAYLANDLNGLLILDISGIDSPAANIGNISASQINVSENMDIGNNLYVGTGVNVGWGIMSNGEVTGSDISATSTIKFNPTNYPPACNGSNQSKGKIYYDESLKELCYCNGSGWYQIDSASTVCN